MENPFEWMDKYNTILIILCALVLPPLMMWRLGGFKKEKPGEKPKRKTVYHSAVSATLQAKKAKEAQNNE